MYFVDGASDFFIESEKPATNALLRYEGIEFESATNDIKELIPGVNLNLKGVTEPGRPLSINVGQDLPKTTIKIKDLVENLNQVFTFIQGQNKLDEKSNTLKTLGGDYGIRNAESRLRTALQENFLGVEGNRTVRSLTDLGIQFNRNGTLAFDEKKLENALNQNFDEVVELLAGNTTHRGVVPHLTQAITSITSSGGGLLSSQRKNFTDSIQKMDKQIADKEKAVERRADALKEKLAKTQTALSAMQNQSNYLSTQMGGGAPPQIG